MSACCCVTAVIGDATCIAWDPKSRKCQRETGFVQPAFLRSWPKWFLTSEHYLPQHFMSDCSSSGNFFADWLVCFSTQEEDESLRLSKKRTRVKKRRYEDDSSEDEITTRRSGGMTTRHKDPVTPSSSSRHSGEGGASKRRRMTTRNQPDLTFCEWALINLRHPHANLNTFSKVASELWG